MITTSAGTSHNIQPSALGGGEILSTAFYAIESVGNTHGSRQRAANRLMFELQLDAYSELDSLDCLDRHAARIATTIGITAYAQEQWTLFMDFLHRWLPKFRKHLRAKAHLQFDHFRKLLSVLTKVEGTLPEGLDYANIMAEIDTFLVRRTTATQPHQATPTPAELARKLKKYLEARRFNATSQNADDHCRASFYPTTTPGLSCMSWTGPADSVLMVERAIQNFAKKHDLSFAKACETYLSQHPDHQQHTTITLLGFAETPDDPVPTYLVGAGELTPQQQQSLQRAKIKYHCIFEVVNLLRADYSPTLAQHAFVKLRDGTCRFPGCTKDALHCQTDHVISHADGGWTATGNLQSLCQHHHNMKTDRRIRATMDSYGVVTWYFPNGDVVTTEPSGKLAGVQSNPKAISTRWGKHTPAETNTEPPSNNGLGNWGYTIKNKLARMQKHIKHKAPPKPPETP